MPLSTFFNLPEEKRQRLLNCAIAEFAQNDYESASVSQIVLKAAISKGSLYQYFQDKHDLHHYLVELASQKKGELLAAAVPPDEQMPFFDRLRWLFREMARYELLYPDLAKIGYRAVYGKSPLPEDVIQQARQSTARYFAGLIDQAKRRGEIRAEIDAQAGAFLIAAVMSQLGGFLADQANLNSTQIVETGIFPVDLPVVQEMFGQVIQVLQLGLAEPLQQAQGRIAE